MASYQRILFATDFSEDNECVIEKCQQLRADFNADLWLMHVVEAMPEHSIGYMMTPDLIQKVTDQAKQALEALGQRLSVPPGQQLIRVGSPRAEILQVAEFENVDLILLGSHGRHGIAKLLGSTATSVLHEADCDVLTVKIKDSSLA